MTDVAPPQSMAQKLERLKEQLGVTTPVSGRTVSESPDPVQVAARNDEYQRDRERQRQQIADTRRPQAEPVELSDLLAREFAPRAWLLNGFLQERDLSMIHAYRGVGKSRFAHGVAVAVASGGTFLRYSAPKPRGVLLVDGELPREDLQKMLAEAVEASDCGPVARLRILSADLSGAPVCSLASEKGRQQIETNLDDACLLLLDSVSTLCPGVGPENDAESWDQMQAWLLSLRRRGITVLLVHHEGKRGTQRGTSKREDVLSQIAQLRRPEDYRATEGARFEVHLTKARAVTGEAAEPYEAQLGVDGQGQPVWTWRPLEDAFAAAASALVAEGMTQRQVAKKLGKTASTVNRALKQHGT